MWKLATVGAPHAWPRARSASVQRNVGEEALAFLRAWGEQLDM
jgi:hypothetical protein